ncbi:MAG TPA: YdeI/OmpD-associated family protein [Candidatus Dormibacteraeota bacterium]|nr:YdeI/OmpD-associated family protein [Candidatus Dormibacteraeota bacterium]
MRFNSTLESAGKTAAGFHVPEAVLDSLAGGRRPKVRVTINRHTWRTSVGIVDGRSMIGIPVEHRAAARVTPGDVLDVDVELDTEVREVTIPDDFAAALAPFPEARAFFDNRNYSERRWFVLGIEDAKTPETRARRIEKAVERLREGRGQR